MKPKEQTSATPALEAGPWDDPALAKLREWEPAWVDQCRKMSNDPWTSGVLPRKDIELISIAVNAAITNLNADGTRRHIRGALAAGATRDEIMMILKMASLLSIHTVSLGAPILLEEAKAAGVKPAPKGPAATPVCDKMKAAGQWNTAWDAFFEIDPAWTEAIIAASLPIYARRHWYKAGQALARADRSWLARLLTRREQPENFMTALHRKPEDIKVVIQFAEA